MSEVTSKIPFDRESYRRSWQPTQADQVSYTLNSLTITYLLTLLGRLR